MKKWLFLPLLLSQQALALAPCTPDTPVGHQCRTAIDQLHPTQPFIGQLQVDETQEKLAKKSSQQLEKYLEEKTFPVVISPEGAYWLLDKHHLTRALWQSGIKEVTVKVVAHLHNDATFWKEMVEKNWAWLKNERGLAIHPDQLPTHISDLPDYGYRSLAGKLRSAGYFNKDKQVYFVEFTWANWLGAQMGWCRSRRVIFLSAYRKRKNWPVVNRLKRYQVTPVRCVWWTKQWL